MSERERERLGELCHVLRFAFSNFHFTFLVFFVFFFLSEKKKMKDKKNGAIVRCFLLHHVECALRVRLLFFFLVLVLYYFSKADAGNRFGP